MTGSLAGIGKACLHTCGFHVQSRYRCKRRPLLPTLPPSLSETWSGAFNTLCGPHFVSKPISPRPPDFKIRPRDAEVGWLESADKSCTSESPRAGHWVIGDEVTIGLRHRVTPTKWRLTTKVRRWPSGQTAPRTRLWGKTQRFRFLDDLCTIASVRSGRFDPFGMPSRYDRYLRRTAPVDVKRSCKPRPGRNGIEGVWPVPPLKQVCRGRLSFPRSRNPGAERQRFDSGKPLHHGVEEEAHPERKSQV
jgi:hypothetical protein